MIWYCFKFRLASEHTREFLSMCFIMIKSFLCSQLTINIITTTTTIIIAVVRSKSIAIDTKYLIIVIVIAIDILSLVFIYREY